LVVEIRDEYRRSDELQIVPQGDLRWLVAGSVKIDDLLEALAIKDPAASQPRSFSTAAGLVHSELRRIPHVGDQLTWYGLQLEIVEMEGPRIIRLLVSLPARDES